MAEQTAEKTLEKVRRFLHLDRMPATVRKPVVMIAGGVCLAAGILMVVAPGPAFVFIPLGLLLLATEFRWAKRWAQKALDWLHRGREKLRALKQRRRAA